MYPTMKQEPLTVVMRDEDIRGDLTIEQARDEQAAGGAPDYPPAFFTSDIFEVADGTTIEDATLKALDRMEGEREANQAILYHFAAHVCSMLTETGIYGAPDPAPLTADEVEETLRQLSAHPAYSTGKEVLIPAEDGTVVRLRNGEIIRDAS